ncbi:hypothetical protein, partial [Acinetobacter baumannii]|uniref:hypothetical protein n=1 Tax=Acinetobacter baumannii TaxID=470 RepID=UPI001C08500D
PTTIEGRRQWGQGGVKADDKGMGIGPAGLRAAARPNGKSRPAARVEAGDRCRVSPDPIIRGAQGSGTGEPGAAVRSPDAP